MVIQSCRYSNGTGCTNSRCLIGNCIKMHYKYIYREKYSNVYTETFMTTSTVYKDSFLTTLICTNIDTTSKVHSSNIILRGVKMKRFCETVVIRQGQHLQFACLLQAAAETQNIHL